MALSLPARTEGQEPPSGSSDLLMSSRLQGISESSHRARLEELGKEIEALRPQVEAARRVAVRADSIHTDSIRHANQVPLDTITVGPLRIATPPDQADLAREVFSDIWQTFQPLLEGSEDLLADELFVFRYGWYLGGMYLEGDRVQSVEMNRRYGMDRLRAKVRDGLGHVLVRALPPEAASIQEWVGMSPLTPPLDWSWIYRELASTPSFAVRGCYRGQAAECWAALGLPRGEGGWKAWYTPEERRLLVSARFARSPVGDRVPLRRIDLLIHGCLHLESDGACLKILEDLPGATPLSVSARASMVAEALSLGGEGAFARMINSPDTSVLGRLTYAAQLPADTLAARWRERVLLARPNLHAELPLAPISTVFWVLLLLLFATRSTRWRLG